MCAIMEELSLQARAAGNEPGRVERALDLLADGGGAERSGAGEIPHDGENALFDCSGVRT